MKNNLKMLLLLTILLTTTAGYSQLIKVSADGYQRWAALENVTTSSGPMQVSTVDKRYTYGLTISYESGDNGVEIGLLNFPYRVDLRFKNFLNTQVNPSNVALVSMLYKRKLINSRRFGIDVYALGGVNFGKYQNLKITEGTGTVSLNGSTIYEGHLDRFSTYDRSTVLLPTLKLEIDKSISKHIIVGANATYLFKNWFNYLKPLEQGTYNYSYAQNGGTGKLGDYGNGLMIGISLK